MTPLGPTWRRRRESARFEDAFRGKISYFEPNFPKEGQVKQLPSGLAGIYEREGATRPLRKVLGLTVFGEIWAKVENFP